MKDDLISRADVEQTVEDNILLYTHSDKPIDQDPDTECHMAIRTALRMLRKDLRKLPSAQPEPSTEIQEILDYLDNTLHPIVSPDNWNVYSELHDMVSKLPSVQPERGTGAWIINDEYPQHCWCSECNHFFSLFDPKSIHFCPNCGSEMKTCVWKSQYEKEN